MIWSMRAFIFFSALLTLSSANLLSFSFAAEKYPSQCPAITTRLLNSLVPYPNVISVDKANPNSADLTIQIPLPDGTTKAEVVFKNRVIPLELYKDVKFEHLKGDFWGTFTKADFGEPFLIRYTLPTPYSSKNASIYARFAQKVFPNFLSKFLNVPSEGELVDVTKEFSHPGALEVTNRFYSSRDLTALEWEMYEKDFPKYQDSHMLSNLWRDLRLTAWRGILKVLPTWAKKKIKTPNFVPVSNMTDSISLIADTRPLKHTTNPGKITNLNVLERHLAQMFLDVADKESALLQKWIRRYEKLDKTHLKEADDLLQKINELKEDVTSGPNHNLIRRIMRFPEYLEHYKSIGYNAVMYAPQATALSVYPLSKGAGPNAKLGINYSYDYLPTAFGAIHPAYGSLQDMKVFNEFLNKIGLRPIGDFVYHFVKTPSPNSLDKVLDQNGNQFFIEQYAKHKRPLGTNTRNLQNKNASLFFLAQEIEEPRIFGFDIDRADYVDELPTAYTRPIIYDLPSMKEAERTLIGKHVIKDWEGKDSANEPLYRPIDPDKVKKKESAILKPIRRIKNFSGYRFFKRFDLPSWTPKKFRIAVDKIRQKDDASLAAALVAQQKLKKETEILTGDNFKVLEILGVVAYGPKGQVAIVNENGELISEGFKNNAGKLFILNKYKVELERAKRGDQVTYINEAFATKRDATLATDDLILPAGKRYVTISDSYEESIIPDPKNPTQKKGFQILNSSAFTYEPWIGGVTATASLSPLKKTRIAVPTVISTQDMNGKEIRREKKIEFIYETQQNPRETYTKSQTIRNLISSDSIFTKKELGIVQGTDGKQYLCILMQYENLPNRPFNELMDATYTVNNLFDYMSLGMIFSHDDLLNLNAQLFASRLIGHANPSQTILDMGDSRHGLSGSKLLDFLVHKELLLHISPLYMYSTFLSPGSLFQLRSLDEDLNTHLTLRDHNKNPYLEDFLTIFGYEVSREDLIALFNQAQKAYEVANREANRYPLLADAVGPDLNTGAYLKSLATIVPIFDSDAYLTQKTQEIMDTRPQDREKMQQRDKEARYEGRSDSDAVAIELLNESDIRPPSFSSGDYYEKYSSGELILKRGKLPNKEPNPKEDPILDIKILEDRVFNVQATLRIIRNEANEIIAREILFKNDSLIPRTFTMAIPYENLKFNLQNGDTQFLPLTIEIDHNSLMGDWTKIFDTDEILSQGLYDPNGIVKQIMDRYRDVESTLEILSDTEGKARLNVTIRPGAVVLFRKDNSLGGEDEDIQ